MRGNHSLIRGLLYASGRYLIHGTEQSRVLQTFAEKTRTNLGRKVVDKTPYESAGSV